MITKDAFFENVEISDTDKTRANIFLKSKGVFIHNKIKEKLKVFTKNKNNIKYAQIASIYRYDKRVRLVLYKYISYFEEYLRGIILDNYYKDYKQMSWIKPLKEKINKYKNLELALENLSFRDLIIQTKQIDNKIMPESFKNNSFLNKNLNSLRVFRNAVMHNKFLLFCIQFEECRLKEKPSGSTLRHNIYNLASFLPSEVSISLISDIDKCKDNKNNENDTAWELPEQFIIILD